MSTPKQLTDAQLQALITGIPLYCAGTVFSVAGQTFTGPQAVTFFESVRNASTAVTAARAAWKASIQALEKSNAGNGQVAHELRESIGLMFSNSPQTLSAFAIAPRKTPKPLTVQARAAATLKAAATRVARGTESKKKKALISGNVTGATLVPITTPVTSAPAATPAVAPTPATPATSNGASTGAAATATHP